MRTKMFRVVNNRFQFRCHECGAKRSMGVGKDVRRRTVRCHKCGKTTPCNLNRRIKMRESQAGKCTMITNQGREIEVDLHDISADGLGFDLPISAARFISLNQELRFKCSWNPRLLGNNRFIVRSIKGSRIGVQKVIRHIT